MIIDYETLSDEALKGIAESFVVSHMSDVDAELNLSEWVEKTIKKIKDKELFVEFSQVDDSVTLKSAEQLEVSVSETIKR